MGLFKKGVFFVVGLLVEKDDGTGVGPLGWNLLGLDFVGDFCVSVLEFFLGTETFFSSLVFFLGTKTFSLNDLQLPLL